MKVYKDSKTGKWKTGSNSRILYDEKTQAQRASMNDLADRLAQVRKKIEESCLNYGK